MSRMTATEASAENIPEDVALTPSSSMITKSEFHAVIIVNELIKEKPIEAQKEVVLRYQNDDGAEQEVEVHHGVITIFSISAHEYFVLGILSENTDPMANGAKELQASIGNNLSAKGKTLGIYDSLKNMVSDETCEIFNLDDFELSRCYVSHRDSHWNLCYVKLIALSNAYSTIDSLNEKVELINEKRIRKKQVTYGIYRLNEIVMAANKTAALPEGNKPLTVIFNHFKHEQESFVVLDDIVINALSNRLSGNLDDLFDKRAVTENSLNFHQHENVITRSGFFVSEIPVRPTPQQTSDWFKPGCLIGKRF